MSNTQSKRPVEAGKVTRSIVFDVDILALAKKAAKEDDRSLSNYINKIVAERLKK
jgi:hypothetical protein